VPGIRAIETSYKGYRFRSRTEARWAVCFDALGLNWTYELEGFDLSGIWYLPDFWLSSLSTWVEIKGLKPTPGELMKAQRLASHSGRRVLICSGQPWAGEHEVILLSGEDIQHDLVFGEINGSLCLVLPNGERIEIQKPYFQRHYGSEYSEDIKSDGYSLHRAFQAAREARFERLEEEAAEIFDTIDTLIANGFGCEHQPPAFESLSELFDRIRLPYIEWCNHTVALATIGTDRVGCIIVRNSDLHWRWFRIDGQHFMTRAPFATKDDGIDPEERSRIVALASREARRDPIAFLDRIGLHGAISWRNLALALHVREKDAELELIVLRITDVQWWAIPFDYDMFDQI
jgi:hypothetical protein